ncbi:MAG TPA: WG repeat-containing protein, partial [Opitutaceae bacterium]
FDGGKTKQDAYLWGLIDATGREVLAPRYVGIKPLTDHLAQVWEPSAQPRSPIGLLDLRTLQVVVPPLYDSELVLAGEGSTAIRVERQKKWWLIDATGRELTPPYDYMGLFREGHLVVRDGERWFWLDRDLKPVHADKGYVKTTDFHKGLARVWSRKADQWGRLGGEALVNYAGEALHTFPDPVGPPAPPAPPEFVACICNGTGKRFREVKVEYSGSGGSALRPYTPGGGTTTTYGSYSKWEYDGVCTACNGTGKLKNLRK